MKSIVPVVMAGVLGIYGLIIAVIISTGSEQLLITLLTLWGSRWEMSVAPLWHQRVGHPSSSGVYTMYMCTVLALQCLLAALSRAGEGLFKALSPC